MQQLDPGTFIFVLGFQIALSLLVFSHAQRHNNPHATAWGIVAFLLALLGATIYLVHFLWTRRRRS